MSHEVLGFTSVNPMVSKFLFFNNPPSLWVSDGQEKHIDILKKSNKSLVDIQAAGALMNDEGQIIVDTNGSTTLGLGKVDASTVVEFIKKLPGIKPHNVQASLY